MKVFNATLEDQVWWCNAHRYLFPKRSITTIPDDYKQFLNEQCWGKGLVVLEYGMDPKQAERSALVNYLKGDLKERIRNYKAEISEFERKGIKISPAKELLRAQRWEKEIMAKLDMEAPLHEELSFLSEEERKRLGITDAKILEFKPKEDLFDPKNIVGIYQPEEKPGSVVASESVEAYDDTDVEKLLSMSAPAAEG